jgi:hypothetical protein
MRFAWLDTVRVRECSAECLDNISYLSSFELKMGSHTGPMTLPRVQTKGMTENARGWSSFHGHNSALFTFSCGTDMYMDFEE